MAKMKPVVLEVKDLSEYRMNETHLYARDGNKDLRLSFSGGIQVWVDGIKVFEHIQPYEAIKFFNEYTPALKPVVGLKIYIPSELHVYRGLDDVSGGLATISEVEVSDHLPVGHINSVFIRVEGVPNHSYNWDILEKKQVQLAKDYAGRIAHPDPDDRPQFNDDNEGWTQVVPTFRGFNGGYHQ